MSFKNRINFKLYNRICSHLYDGICTDLLWWLHAVALVAGWIECGFDVTAVVCDEQKKPQANDWCGVRHSNVTCMRFEGGGGLAGEQQNDRMTASAALAFLYTSRVVLPTSNRSNATTNQIQHEGFTLFVDAIFICGDFVFYAVYWDLLPRID